MSLHVDPQSLPLNSAEWTDLVEAESRREQAMLSGDVETLATVLAENAVYIHSSAVVDDERTYLIPLRSGDVRYEAIDITVAKQITVEGHGHSGVLRFQANMYNVFNLLQLQPITNEASNTSIQNQNFGQSLGADAGRVIEFLARFQF